MRLSSVGRQALSVLLIVALIRAAALPVAAAVPEITRLDYEACQAREENAFQAAIKALTEKALARGLAKVDMKALVAVEWRKAGFDDIIDKRVDIATAEVRDETAWSDLLKSLAYREKSQELAAAVADRVYRSEAIKTTLEGVASGVGRELARQIEIVTVDAAEPAQLCLHAFLGPRYGSMVARTVTTDAGRAFAVDAEKGAAEVTSGQVLAQGTEGVAGAVVLLVRRQLANMASRVGQRIVGSVLSRLVSTVAGGVGLVLIAKDIWDFRHGVLPIISGEMKSRESKDKVQAELARTIEEQIGEHTRDIAGITAERIVEIWRQFKAAHAKVLDLAEADETFRRYIDSLPAGSLARLDEVVGLVLAKEGESGVKTRLQDGSLQGAVSALPEDGMAIARELKDLEAGLQWTALAGTQLPAVIEYGIYKRAEPKAFTRDSLAKLIAIKEPISIGRLAAVTADARAALFQLDATDLRTLARGLTEGELETLARYQTGLSRGASERILRAVAETPVKMQLLASSRVRDAILSSQDQAAAVAMMLRAGGFFDPFALVDDVRMVSDGRVNPLLLWDRHGTVLSVLAGGLLLLLLILRWALFGGRRRRASTAGQG